MSFPTPSGQEMLVNSPTFKKQSGVSHSSKHFCQKRGGKRGQPWQHRWESHSEALLRKRTSHPHKRSHEKHSLSNLVREASWKGLAFLPPVSALTTQRSPRQTKDIKAPTEQLFKATYKSPCGPDKKERVHRGWLCVGISVTGVRKHVFSEACFLCTVTHGFTGVQLAYWY